MKLSRLTIGYGVYIVISAAYMLQVNVWLTEKVGNPFLYRSFWITAAVALTAAVAYALRLRLRVTSVLAVLAVFALAYFLGAAQHYFEDKTHILMYGLLGYLAAGDLFRSGPAWPSKAAPVAAAVAFVALISVCDEGFQWILPYRFGDINDCILNILGGILGICLRLALNTPPRQPSVNLRG